MDKDDWDDICCEKLTPEEIIFSCGCLVALTIVSALVLAAITMIILCRISF